MLASESQLDQDVVFDILSSARRRYAISILNRRGGPMELTELAEEIAALEAETTVDGLTKQQRKRVYVSLYQTHVPKMEEVGIVTYDQEKGTVALAEGVDAVEMFLSEPESNRHWPNYYFGLSLVAGAVLAVTILDIGPFAALPDAVVAGVTVLAFLVLAAAQYVMETMYNESPPEIR